MTWPEDKTKTLNFEDMVNALKTAYKKKVWTGPPVPKDLAHVVLDYRKQFTKKQLDWALGNGRDLLAVVLGVAIQLGIEQGKRIRRGEEAEEAQMKRILAKD